jgi:hypothetical protein
MKRIFSLLFLGVLILSVSIVTCAEGNFKAYGDYMVGGKYNYSDYTGNGSINYSLFLLGGQYTIDKFKMSGEMSLSSQISGSNCNVSLLEIKGGYNLIQNETSKFDVTGGYLIVDFTTSKAKYSGIMIGADGALVISDAATLEGSFGIGLSNDFAWYDGSSYTRPGSVGIFDYKIKVNFIVADNLAISGGLRGYSMSRNYSTSTTTEGFSGLTLGVSLKF